MMLGYAAVMQRYHNFSSNQQILRAFAIDSMGGKRIKQKVAMSIKDVARPDRTCVSIRNEASRIRQKLPICVNFIPAALKRSEVIN